MFSSLLKIVCVLSLCVIGSIRAGVELLESTNDPSIRIEDQHLVAWVETPQIRKLREIARAFAGRQIVITINGTNTTWPFYNSTWWNNSWPRPPHQQYPNQQHYPQTNTQAPVAIKTCLDNKHEVYQDCGRKCVLGCRFATQSSSSSAINIGKHECDKLDSNCVEGCFCKTGLVRHQSKCIPARECPIRKCHRDEVYMCGPASPITCDNALRRSNVTHVTKLIDCVWGCFCASGHLRSNHNGKCVPETECIKDNHVEYSAQVPGVFRLGFGHHHGGGTYYPAGTDNNAGYGQENWNNGGGNHNGGGGNYNGGGGNHNGGGGNHNGGGGNHNGGGWYNGPPNGWWNWNNGSNNQNGNQNGGGYGLGNTTYNFINGSVIIAGSNNCNGTGNGAGTNTCGSVTDTGKK